MTEEQAKRHLERMLDSYKAGSILHLLAEIFRDAAAEARRANDTAAYRRCKGVEHALFVVGLGIDAACPR